MNFTFTILHPGWYNSRTVLAINLIIDHHGMKIVIFIHPNHLINGALVFNHSHNYSQYIITLPQFVMPNVRYEQKAEKLTEQ